MHVTVATIALEGRGSSDLMLATLASLTEQGFRACVGDGGSSPAFVRKIQEMGHDVQQPGRGLRGQMEAAFTGAAEHGTHVFYLESDKLEFAQTQLGRTLDRYRARRLDHATIGRNRDRFDTFPFAQRQIERAESALIGDVLSIRGDWVAGPVILPSSHVANLSSSRFSGTDQHGWGVPWFLLGRAWADGKRVGLINTGCGVHPSAAEEFNPGYRLYQATSILGGFYEGAGIPYDWRTATGARLDRV